LLISINVLFLLFICIKRPHSSTILFILDIVIESIVLLFEILLLVYNKNSTGVINVISIIVHVFGFLTANVSLIIAIILNLIAYYNIIICLKDLLAHLKDR
jgi:hypothetical protein